MKKLIAIVVLAASLIPVAAFAAAKSVPTTYICSKCHMKFSASKAKADHYKDPMDGGKLVPVAPTKHAKPSSTSMGGMKM